MPQAAVGRAACFAAAETCKRREATETGNFLEQLHSRNTEEKKTENRRGTAAGALATGPWRPGARGGWARRGGRRGRPEKKHPAGQRRRVPKARGGGRRALHEMGVSLQAGCIASRRCVPATANGDGKWSRIAVLSSRARVPDRRCSKAKHVGQARVVCRPSKASVRLVKQQYMMNDDALIRWCW